MIQVRLPKDFVAWKKFEQEALFVTEHVVDDFVLRHATVLFVFDYMVRDVLVEFGSCLFREAAKAEPDVDAIHVGPVSATLGDHLFVH